MLRAFTVALTAFAMPVAGLAAPVERWAVDESVDDFTGKSRVIAYSLPWATSLTRSKNAAWHR